MSPLLPGPLRGLRTALLTTGLLLAVIWAVEIVNLATDYSLTGYGITPRRLDELPDVLTAPYVHASLGHIIGNTVPLAVLAFLCATRGFVRFAAVTLTVSAVGGLGVWLISPSGTSTVGASILVFGYFGYLLVRGFVDRRIFDILLAFAITSVYGWTMLWGVFPSSPSISWQGHVFGFAGGVAAAFALRRERDGRGERAREARNPRGQAAASGPRPLSDELKDMGLL
ncbi:hypothetical protein GCM10023205_84260 [Yinghuangia aomiensis]|uniref:Peptidase S54 rhomboid domain-containing protein n=1 Tax=Yinghuangia aomiensis TaxID=676205 RepID=A0ABP9IIJ3_9ACTN